MNLDEESTDIPWDGYSLLEGEPVMACFNVGTVKYAFTRSRTYRVRPALGYQFEQQGFGINKPGAWMRWYATMQGYCREFGWRACFLGGGE